MKECKILEFSNADGTLIEKSDARRYVKSFGTYYTEEHMRYRNNHLSDYPWWEKELNSYLQSGWTIQSMTYNSNGHHLLFLLVR